MQKGEVWKDSFIFQIGCLCQEDMERIEATYREFLANNLSDKD